jgi:hypothetical protein
MGAWSFRRRLNRSGSPWLWLGVGLLWILSACRADAPAHSELFQQLFRSDTTAFRGVDPGDPIARALSQEDRSHLIHQDELGLAYRLPLPPAQQELLIDYHSDNLRTERRTNRIASIVAHLNLGDEVETSQLYAEVEDYLNQRYGVASGSYGHYVWEGLTRHLTRMEVHLRLSDTKKGMTLNFVDTEPTSTDSLTADIELDSMGRPLLLRLPVGTTKVDSSSP